MVPSTAPPHRELGVRPFGLLPTRTAVLVTIMMVEELQDAIHFHICRAIDLFARVHHRISDHH